jgi:hypothetical protein
MRQNSIILIPKFIYSYICTLLDKKCAMNYSARSIQKLLHLHSLYSVASITAHHTTARTARLTTCAKGAECCMGVSLEYMCMY